MKYFVLLIVAGKWLVYMYVYVLTHYMNYTVSYVGYQKDQCEGSKSWPF